MLMMEFLNFISILVEGRKDLKLKSKMGKENDNCTIKKKKKTSIYYLIILFIFIGGFIYSGYELFKIYQKYEVAIEEYDGLKSYIKEITSEEDRDNELRMEIDFQGLEDINSDIVGWIYFENVNVNYPIMKGIDNSYYLHHTFKKDTNSSGSIFMDYRNDSNFTNSNTIIYGHNMRNGSMFGELMKLLDEKFYNENSYFWILTNGNKYKCEIFSLYIDESTSESYNIGFKSKEDYSNYLNMITEKSIYNTEIIPTVDDLVITLSTCSSAEGSSRFIVHSKLKRLE